MPPRRVITGRSQEPRRRFAEELRLLRLERGVRMRGLTKAVGWDPVATTRAKGDRAVFAGAGIDGCLYRWDARRGEPEGTPWECHNGYIMTRTSLVLPGWHTAAGHRRRGRNGASMACRERGTRGQQGGFDRTHHQ